MNACAAGPRYCERTKGHSPSISDRWQVWTCACCKRVFHWDCSGVSDDYPEICDDCWSRIIGPDRKRPVDDDDENQRAREMLRLMRLMEATS